MTSLDALTVITAPFWTLSTFFEALARNGHKVARDKIQLHSLCVWDLGNDISATEKTISTDQESTSNTFLSLKQNGNWEVLRSLVGEYKMCIPNFSMIASSLSTLTSESSSDLVIWNLLFRDAFKNLKGSLLSPHTLGLLSALFLGAKRVLTLEYYPRSIMDAGDL